MTQHSVWVLDVPVWVHGITVSVQFSYNKQCMMQWLTACLHSLAAKEWDSILWQAGGVHVPVDMDLCCIAHRLNRVWIQYVDDSQGMDSSIADWLRCHRPQDNDRMTSRTWSQVIKQWFMMIRRLWFSRGKCPWSLFILEVRSCSTMFPLCLSLA